MRRLLFLAFLFKSVSAYSCADALKNFNEECALQERYTKLNEEFKNLSINLQDLKGYKVPRALAQKDFGSEKNMPMIHTKKTLEQNQDWLSWQKGQHFITKLNVIYLTQNDVLKLHKSLFATNKVMTDAGKLRINQGVTNPMQIIHCDEKILTRETIDYFDETDLKSAENYPLLELTNIQQCKNKNHYSGQLIYYKGASVKQELTRWLNDFNDMLIRYEANRAPSDLSPLSYVAGMRRWFLAIAPFGAGNLEVANTLTDYFNKRLGLMPLPLKDLKNSQIEKPETSRKVLLKRSFEVLNFFEACLYENKVKPVSSNCSSLN